MELFKKEKRDRKESERLIDDLRTELQEMIDNLPILEDITKTGELKAYAINAFKISLEHRNKVVTEHKVTDKKQYQFFMLIIDLMGLTQEQKDTAESINLVFD